MNTQGAPQELLALTRELLIALHSPLVANLLASWPAPGGAATLPHGAAPDPPLPVLRWLPRIAADAPAFAARLIVCLGRTAPTLAWRRTYTAAELGEDFIENYGYTVLVGPGALLASERIACGFLLLGPRTLYPSHRHEAEEVYVPLSGTAQWLQGDAVWRHRSPGTIIHHASEEPHAMRTAAEPLLALYLWRSNDLNQPTRLDAIER